MEEICNALSAKISETGTGVYAVFYEDELLDALPEDARNRETLEAALKKLNKEGYIDVRYARGSAFCLSSVRPYVYEKPSEKVEADEIEQTQPHSPCRTKKTYLFIGLCSFLGGLAGGLCVLIGAVIL